MNKKLIAATTPLTCAPDPINPNESIENQARFLGIWHGVQDEESAQSMLRSDGQYMVVRDKHGDVFVAFAMTVKDKLAHFFYKLTQETGKISIDVSDRHFEGRHLEALFTTFCSPKTKAAYCRYPVLNPESSELEKQARDMAIFHSTKLTDTHLRQLAQEPGDYLIRQKEDGSVFLIFKDRNPLNNNGLIEYRVGEMRNKIVIILDGNVSYFNRLTDLLSAFQDVCTTPILNPAWKKQLQKRESTSSSFSLGTTGEFEQRQYPEIENLVKAAIQKKLFHGVITKGQVEYLLQNPGDFITWVDSADSDRLIISARRSENEIAHFFLRDCDGHVINNLRDLGKFGQFLTRYKDIFQTPVEALTTEERQLDHVMTEVLLGSIDKQVLAQIITLAAGRDNEMDQPSIILLKLILRAYEKDAYRDTIDTLLEGPLKTYLEKLRKHKSLLAEKFITTVTGLGREQQLNTNKPFSEFIREFIGQIGTTKKQQQEEGWKGTLKKKSLRQSQSGFLISSHKISDQIVQSVLSSRAHIHFRKLGDVTVIETFLPSEPRPAHIDKMLPNGLVNGVVGHGGFGQINVGCIGRPGKGKYIAVKIPNPGIIDSALQEVDIYTRLPETKKDYFLKMLDVVRIDGPTRDDAKIFIALPLMRMDLKKYTQYMLENVVGKSMSVAQYETRLIQIAFILLSGIAELHKNGIVHMDIKPENIMLNDENWVRYIDFGTAIFAQSQEALQQFEATIGFESTNGYWTKEMIEFNSQLDLYKGYITIKNLITGYEDDMKQDNRKAAMGKAKTLLGTHYAKLLALSRYPEELSKVAPTEKPQVSEESLEGVNLDLLFQLKPAPPKPFLNLELYDLRTIGYTLFYLLKGKLPYEDNQYMQREKITRQEAQKNFTYLICQMPNQAKSSAEGGVYKEDSLMHLIATILNPDVQSMTAKELLKHPVFGKKKKENNMWEGVKETKGDIFSTPILPQLK